MWREERGQCERADGTEKLEALRERDADFVDGDVIQNVGERDAGDRGDYQEEIHVSAHLKRRRGVSEGEHQR